MKYTSENGYTGTMNKSYFFGIKHWDFSIFDKDGKFVFHATLSEPYTKREFEEEVDKFPKTLEVLSNLSRKKRD